jgi:hypothetical protein
MPKAREKNLYDLVEDAAARRGVPRLKLWEDILRALIDETLHPLNLNLSERPNPTGSAITYRGWFSGILHAVVMHPQKSGPT